MNTIRINILAILLLQVTITMVTSQFQNTCDQRQINNCLDALKPHADSFDMNFGFGEDALRVNCQYLLQSARCVENLNRLCFNEQQKLLVEDTFAGTINVIYQLCGNTPFRADYLKNVGCIQRMQSQQMFCGQQYIGSRTFATSTQEEFEKSYSYKCCAFDQFLNCTRYGFESMCGYESAVFMENFVREMAGKNVAEKCTSEVTGECSDATTFTTYPPTATALVLAVIIVLVSRWS